MTAPTPDMQTLTDTSADDLARIDARLSALVPAATVWPAKLHSAQRHTLLAPGKRLRPRLTLLIAEGYGAPSPAALDTACVSELVHAASLILDDLPCMDDADLRRNRPTTHLAFDEATAVLAATALLNRAFGILMAIDAPAETKVELGAMLAHAIGSDGLIAGQIADLANDNADTSASDVQRLNALKTGALFDFCVDAGALLGKAPAPDRAQLATFSRELGLAFQLMDDLKDQLLTPGAAAKTTQRDDAKQTLVTLQGVAPVRTLVRDHVATARTALDAAHLPTAPQIARLLDTYLDALAL